MSSSMSIRRKRSTPAAMIACRSRKRPPSAMIACRTSKRRRPRAAATSESESESESWASLHEDLVGLIGCRLLDSGDLLDYVRFRAVCPHWRSSTLRPRGRGLVDPRFHPRRWMMLPEGHGLYPGHRKLRGYVRFLNLSTAAIVRAPLPLFKDHCILDSVDGLLLLQRDHDSAIRLLNPLTGDIAELPPLTTIMPRPGVPPDERILANTRDVRATSFTVSADGVITVMLALPRIARIAFATTTDHQWRLATWELPPIRGPVSLQGKMYMVDLFRPTATADCTETRVFQIDPPQDDGTGSSSSSLLPPELIATCLTGRFTPPHIAECGSEILLVGASDHNYSHMTVYRLADLILGRAVPVTSIGDNVLFIGESFLSVSSSALPNVVGNSIVTIHCGKERYIGQYHLSSATWSPAADGCFWDIPSPLSFIYHIFTCCHRAIWNKGGIWCQRKGRTFWRVKRKLREGA